MTLSSMHKMVFVPTIIPTFKAPACTNTQVRTKLKKKKQELSMQWPDITKRWSTSERDQQQKQWGF